MFDFISKDEGNFLAQNKHSLGICTAYEYTQLRLPDKDPTITGLVVYNIWNVSVLGPTIKVWSYDVISHPHRF